MGTLIAAYIFGSIGRGDHDSRSDLDILAVVRDGAGKVGENVVHELVPQSLVAFRPSISWYGQNRLREMFANGELFAWHLAQESLPLFETVAFLDQLGTPAPYKDAIEDVRSFQNVLRGIPAQVSANRHNALYEAGLIYVCLRNIAMAASSKLCARPDFSRYSPFNLGGLSQCPITVEEYEQTMACRLAGQRGAALLEAINAEFVLSVYRRLEPWIDELVTAL